MTKQKITTCLSLLFIAPPAFAQLEPIVVEYQVPPLIINDSIASVTVLTEKEIASQQKKSLAELLSNQVGINLAGHGGQGKVSHIFLRGSNDNHTVIYLDDVRINNGTYGTAALEHIDVAQIKRIEIMRGQHSSRYGADAIGGVIRIYTRDPVGENHTSITAGVGTEESQSIAGSYANGPLFVSASHYLTEGINATEAGDPDKDGYENGTISLSLAQPVGASSELKANFHHSEGTNEYDDQYVPSAVLESDFRQQSASLSGKFEITKQFTSQLTLAAALDENNNHSANFFANDSHFHNKSSQVHWDNELQINDQGIISFGVEQQKEWVFSSEAYTGHSQKNQAGYVEYQANLSRHTLLLSMRQDDHDRFGQHTTGAINWGVQLNRTTQINASAATGFKAPTLNDLYWPTTTWATGNENLKPEKSESYEIGIRKNENDSTLAISLYRINYDNLIDWHNAPSGWTYKWQPFNAERAVIKGADVEIKTAAKQWQLGLNISLLDAKNQQSETRLPHRSAITTQFNMDRAFEQLSLHADLLLRSHSYEDTDNTQRIPGYGVANLGISYAVNENSNLDLKIGNLFDHEYQTSAGYNTLGRTLFVTANYRR